MRKPVGIVYLLRCGFKYHDRAFTDLLMAESEADKIKKETGKRPEVVMRTTNGKYVGRYILCVNRYEGFEIDGKDEYHDVDSHDTYLTVESLNEHSSDMKYIRELVDAHNLSYNFSAVPGDEYCEINCPYIKTFNDAGTIEVLYTKYSVKRIRVIRK